MLAEKFFLILETIMSNRSSDGAPRVVSKGPFVPVDDYFFLDKCRRWAHEIRQSSTEA